VRTHLNRVYLGIRSFSSSGSSMFWTRRQSASAIGSPLIVASSRLTLAMSSSRVLWQRMYVTSSRSHRPDPHFSLVVEPQPVKRGLGRQPRGRRTNPQPLAAHRPAVAHVGVLVDVRLVDGDPQLLVALGARQHLADGLAEARLAKEGGRWCGRRSASRDHARCKRGPMPSPPRRNGR
jgi:hypothetical protein